MCVGAERWVDATSLYMCICVKETKQTELLSCGHGEIEDMSRKGVAEKMKGGEKTKI